MYILFRSKVLVESAAAVAAARDFLKACSLLTSAWTASAEAPSCGRVRQGKVRGGKARHGVFSVCISACSLVYSHHRPPVPTG